MTKSRYGMLAGIFGAALAAWWWQRREQMAHGMSSAGRAHHDRGEVIFRNTPQPSDL